MLISAAYIVANAAAAWLHTRCSGGAHWWVLTTATRNEDPKINDGVSSTTIPSGVLELSGPPADPSHPSHSAICPTSYVMAQTVAITADQNPTAVVAAGT